MLIWLDLEMTGLNPEQDVILEIATLITDHELNVVAEGPNLVIHQEESVLLAMDDWNQRQHTQSGLIDAVRVSTMSVAEAETQTLNFIQQHVAHGASPLCGNSIGQDRRFLCRYMTHLAQYVHYRNLDVSTLKILTRLWNPTIKPSFKKSSHRALEDIKDSVEELRFYRTHFLISSSESKKI